MLQLAELIELLAQKEFVSGQVLAGRLGVTRAAIWKQVETLRKLGYEINANPRKGYQLISRPDKLYPWEVRKGLNTKLVGKTMEYYDELPSTNLRAKELLATSPPEGTVIIAESQTKGRGRLGRKWHSPPGTGIWMSIILNPKIPPIQLPKLTLVAAVALSRAIYAELGVRPLVKWPNDLYLKGRKISGILTELVGEMGRLEHVILGVGINVNQKREDFPEDLREKAGSLLMVNERAVDRQALLCQYFQMFEEEYFRSLEEGFVQVLDYCRRYTVTLGQQVEVDNGAKIFYGRAVEIADDGGLILEQDGKRVKVLSGDVNLFNKEQS